MAEEIKKFIATPIVYHGQGALSRLSSEVEKLGGKRVGIVTDGGIVKSGIKDDVIQALNREAFWFEEVQPEPPLETVDACVEFVRKNGCDLLVGLGGGSSIDTAKMASVMVTNPGKVSDYFGVDKVPKPGIPLIAVPTTAGTGSEVSPAAVFVDTADHSKKGVRSDYLLPRLALLDPRLTVTLPRHLTASTGIDALTHAIEGYTSLQRTLMSDIMAERSMQFIEHNLREAYSHGENMSARHGMLMASYMAGITLAIANVGVVHALAQTLGGQYGVSHGVANSLFLPYVMEFNRIGCRDRYAKVALFLGESVEGLSLDEASRRAVQAVRRISQDIKIPQHLRDLDIPEDCIDVISERCLKTQGRLVALNPRSATLEDLKEILRKAY